MATNEGRSVGSTFKNLLNIDNSNAGIDSTSRQVQDGEGTTTELYLSTTNIKATFANDGLRVLDTNASHYLSIVPGSNLTANRTLTITTGDANRTLTLDTDFTASAVITASSSTTLTNKTINLSSNTLTGTIAEFNTALNDGNFATQAGSETLTNKSIDLTNNTLVGSVSEFNAALESADFYTTGGTDVSLADGGTGASLADPEADRLMFWDDSTGAVTWATIGSGLTMTDTTLTASGSSAASTGEMETASSTTVFSSPGRQHRHPGHPKAWAQISFSGAVPQIEQQYNVTSVTDNATGDTRVNYTTAFSDEQACMAGLAVTNGTITCDGTESVNYCRVKCFDTSFVAADSNFNVAVFGDFT